MKVAGHEEEGHGVSGHGVSGHGELQGMGCQDMG